MKNVFEVTNKVLSAGSATKGMGEGRSAEHIWVAAPWRRCWSRRRLSGKLSGRGKSRRSSRGSSALEEKHASRYRHQGEQTELLLHCGVYKVDKLECELKSMVCSGIVRGLGVWSKRGGTERKCTHELVELQMKECKSWASWVWDTFQRGRLLGRYISFYPTSNWYNFSYFYRLLGFPSSFSFPASVGRRARYKALGNSLNVTVVSLLLKHLLAPSDWISLIFCCPSVIIYFLRSFWRE